MLRAPGWETCSWGQKIQWPGLCELRNNFRLSFSIFALTQWRPQPAGNQRAQWPDHSEETALFLYCFQELNNMFHTAHSPTENFMQPQSCGGGGWLALTCCLTGQTWAPYQCFYWTFLTRNAKSHCPFSSLNPIPWTWHKSPSRLA